MFVNGSGRNEQSLQRTCHRCFVLSFGSFGQTVSEKKNFKNQPIRNKNRLWQPCLLMNRDEMSNLYRGLPIDDTYQVSDHLAKRFQRRRFVRNQPIRNKNCLWWPCFIFHKNLGGKYVAMATTIKCVSKVMKFNIYSTNIISCKYWSNIYKDFNYRAKTKKMLNFVIFLHNNSAYR
jgi:hypothetical protein